MLVIAVVIAGVISFFGEMVFRMFFYGGFRGRGGDDRRGGGAAIAIVIAIALIVVAWILSVVIRFALSRRREFLADAGSVELTKNPDAMIRALRKIENRGELARANSAVMEMCVDNPRVGFSDLFATHPSVEARVKALVEFAGGHDPGPLELAPPETVPQVEAPPEGPWSDPPADRGKPFLPGQSPVGPLGGQAPGGPWGDPPAPPGGPNSGPWGPRRG
jgi:heat shock protein HtpX